jgi:hypothetical protein
MRRIVLYISTVKPDRQEQQTVGISGDQRHPVGLGAPGLALRCAFHGPGAVMGIRLVTEVLDRYHGPDARKLWLVSWAEKANDRTRAGWPTREVLAHRTGRSPSRVSHISDELVTEGVLKRDGGGNRSGPARFILLPLHGTGKGALRAHPLNGGEDAAETAPDPAGKSAARPHPLAAGKSAARPHPQPEVKGAESARKGAESARKGADPSLLPAETGSLPLSKEPSEEQPSVPTVAADAPTAQTILAAFIDWVRASGGDLTRRTTGQLAKQIGDLLEQNVPDRYIRKGLADWYASGHNPATFDSFANAALNAAARNRGGGNGGQAPGPERARGWVAAGRAFQAQAERAGKELPA